MSQETEDLREQVITEIEITKRSQRLYPPTILEKLKEVYPENRRCIFLKLAEPGQIPLASCGLAEPIEVSNLGIQALADCPEIQSGRTTRNCLIQNL